MSPARRSLAARRAERALERDYEQLKATTLRALDRKLKAQHVHYDSSDLEGFYNQAWHALYAKLADGEVVENPGGFLSQAAYFRAIDDYRKLHPDRRIDDADTERIAATGDVDEQLDDVRQLREFVEAMNERLNDRERSAAALCYLHGYTRPEAAEALGLSDKRMQKLMDAVSKKVGRFVSEIRDGAWCESRTSLMTAYALNILEPGGERHRQAVEHLKGCSGCRAFVLRSRGLAAVVPPMLLPWAALKVPFGALLAGVAGGGGAAAAGGGAGAGGGASASAGAGASGGGVGAGAVAAGVGIAAVAAAGALAATGTIDVGGRDKPKPAVARTAPQPPPRATSPPAPAPASKPAPRRPKPKKKAKAKKRPATSARAAVVTSTQAPAPPPVTRAAPPPPKARTTPLRDAAQEFSPEGAAQEFGATGNGR